MVAGSLACSIGTAKWVKCMENHQKNGKHQICEAAKQNNKKVTLRNWRKLWMHSGDVRKKFHPINHLLWVTRWRRHMPRLCARYTVFLHLVSAIVVLVVVIIIISSWNALVCYRFRCSRHQHGALFLSASPPKITLVLCIFCSLPLLLSSRGGPCSIFCTLLVMQSRSSFAITFRASCRFPFGFITTWFPDWIFCIIWFLWRDY